MEHRNLPPPKDLAAQGPKDWPSESWHGGDQRKAALCRGRLASAPVTEVLERVHPAEKVRAVFVFEAAEKGAARAMFGGTRIADGSR